MSDMFRTVTLAGIKHSGKSTLGRLLAERCGADFYDIDDVLSEEHHMTTRELFRSVGEEKFRSLEAQAVSKIAALDGRKVISLGGGAVTNSFITEDVWQKLGTKVMIDVSDEIAEKRVFANGVPAYLEKYSDPVGALKEINSARRTEMKKRCQLVYTADGNLTAEEQSVRFHTFLEQKDIL